MDDENNNQPSAEDNPPAEVDVLAIMRKLQNRKTTRESAEMYVMKKLELSKKINMPTSQLIQFIIAGIPDHSHRMQLGVANHQSTVQEIIVAIEKLESCQGSRDRSRSRSQDNDRNPSEYTWMNPRGKLCYACNSRYHLLAQCRKRKY